MNIHELGGCAPTPLAHYLKALGILRLVAEQADPAARAWWEGERFFLSTEQSDADLENFLLEHYEPTPMIAPWNAGSGFFKTWDPKKHCLRGSKNVDALVEIINRQESRWSAFTACYETARLALERNLDAVDVSSIPAKDRGKLLIVPVGEGPVLPVARKDGNKHQIQRALIEANAENKFFRSVILMLDEDRVSYPSIWGTGGNDLKLEFTARYFESLNTVFPADKATTSVGLLRSALWGETSTGLLTGPKGKVGQFLPGSAGGANSTAGFGGQNDTQLNPWDFILMLEGAICLTSSVQRRISTSEKPAAGAPFATRSMGAGYASGSYTDEESGSEQWLPLWRRALSYTELSRLFLEGRAQLHRRGSEDAIGLSQAAMRLGVSLGITEFVRYAFLTRNGDRSTFACPIGRLRVSRRSALHLQCVDDIYRDNWFDRVRSRIRSTTKPAPARLRAAEKRATECLLALIQAGPQESNLAKNWQEFLIAQEAVVGIQKSSHRLFFHPTPLLRPSWVGAADDQSAEFRLAVCFSLQGRRSSMSAQTPSWIQDGIRRHWLPLEQLEGGRQPTRFSTSGSAREQSLRKLSDVVMHGRSGMDDAIAVVGRRLVEAAGQKGQRLLPLQAAARADCHTSDLAALLRGDVDLDRVLNLARALMAVDAKQWAASHVRCAPPDSAEADPDEAWMVLRLALLPWALRNDMPARTEPAAFRRLAAGDAPGAFEIARRRLIAMGLRPSVRLATADAHTSRLWAAAMAFPISLTTAQRFARHIDPNFSGSSKETTHAA